MTHNRHTKWNMIIVWGMLIVIFNMACGLFSNPFATPTTTTSGYEISSPTPTIIGAGIVSPTPSMNICEGLGGELEMQVLVGPSEAVGLEPLAIGAIPFSVISGDGAHVVQGSGSISYQDVLEEEWGTYTVYFDLEATASGECVGDPQSEVLNITVTTSGEQYVEVRSEGFQGDYPWSGSHEFNLSFPITEGATAEGEGWVFVLHLNN